MKRNTKKIIFAISFLSLLTLFAPTICFAKTSPIVKQVTGGGWIMAAACGQDVAKKTFGFNVMELEDGTIILRGNVEFVEHGSFGGRNHGFPHVHGYEITWLTIDGNEARFGGFCRLNGMPGTYPFNVRVIDEDEPGKHDWFSIVVDDIPDVLSGHYYAGAELGFPEEAGGGGNIQLHKPAP